MNKLIFTALTLTLAMNAHLAISADDAISNDSNFANKDTPQQMEQAKTKDGKPAHKHMMHRKHMGDCMGSMKTIDANQDGMVSKDEYMSYHEKKFDSMKKTEGMIELGHKKPSMANDANNSSMNDKPMGTTTGNPNVNSNDATNGKKY